MKVRLTFVPHGGGEADYGLDFDLPCIPQSGDYIQITRHEKRGAEEFIVRRTRWHLEYPDSESQEWSGVAALGKVYGLTIECESQS
jgi:hypothetical protein